MKTRPLARTLRVRGADLLDEPQVHGRGHVQGQLAHTKTIDRGGVGHSGEAPPVVLEPAAVAAAAAQAQAQARRGAGPGPGGHRVLSVDEDTMRILIRVWCAWGVAKRERRKRRKVSRAVCCRACVRRHSLGGGSPRGLGQNGGG
jgi:hypothetical protein